MSNLKLPTLTVENLRKLTKGKDRKIAHNTRVVWESETAVDVIYHNTAIASIQPGHVFVRTGGYSTMTTLARIHAVLMDNGIPYGATRRDWQAIIINMDAKRTIATSEGLSTGIMFNRQADGQWSSPNISSKPAAPVKVEESLFT